MERGELRTLGERVSGEARAIRAVYPNPDAMRAVCVSEVPTASFGDDEGAGTFWTALGYLRAEMVLVRDGKSNTLTVLDDELAIVERLLPDL